jgi:hypothetical protein
MVKFVNKAWMNKTCVNYNDIRTSRYVFYFLFFTDILAVVLDGVDYQLIRSAFKCKL